MITYNGPAASKWKTFGALGQAATISPVAISPKGATSWATSVPAEPQNQTPKSSLGKVAEIIAYLAAGGLLVYFIMTFSGGTEHREFHS